jgi:hypothetical protein
MSVRANADPVELAANAPDRYEVVKGDTLWGIAGKFLQEPWRWPEVWRLNTSQIKNPHRIYPGDLILLDFSNGTPRLRLGKQLRPEVRIEPIPREVPSIPVHLIEPFISLPLVVEENGLADAPQVIGMEASRVVLGNGDDIFVLGIKEDHPRWHIYRPDAPVKDPVNGKVLAYEARYLGTAQVKTPGEVTILKILTTKEEIQKGDLLVPASEPNLEPYVPHEAGPDVMGHIVSVYGAVQSGAKDSVVMIDRGAKDGIERGHVLSIHSRRTTTYKDHKTGKTETRELPEERYGIIFVFRVFDHVSYALVMEAVHPLFIGDAVRNP